MQISQPSDEIKRHISVLHELSAVGPSVSEDEVRAVMAATVGLFRAHVLASGYDPRRILALITKFRDAGRRSAPWRPTSSRVPGRPQDGADGNRRTRWLFDLDHKYYATEVEATLVEVKYYFQTLSMSGAPALPAGTIQTDFVWLLGHNIEPGAYRDPIQLIDISFAEFINDARTVQSGHLVPLDRDGKHVPGNAFLMLARSNQLQGNQTLDELISLMDRIVRLHREAEPPYLDTADR
jgi:hypothetical protein